MPRPRSKHSSGGYGHINKRVKGNADRTRKEGECLRACVRPEQAACLGERGVDAPRVFVAPSGAIRA